MDLRFLRVRLAQEKDVEALWGLVKQVADFAKVEWSLNAIREDLRNPRSRVFVALANDKLIGFLFTMKLAPGEMEIRHLALAPARWGSGVARMLITKFKEEAPRPSKVYFEVASSNFRALRFYEKLGAKRLYLRKNYYGAEDGFVCCFEWA